MRHLQADGGETTRAAPFSGERDRLSADPFAAPRCLQVQFVEQRKASVEFETVAEGDADIACGFAMRLYQPDSTRRPIIQSERSIAPAVNALNSAFILDTYDRKNATENPALVVVGLAAGIGPGIFPLLLRTDSGGNGGAG
jgi:hypothetical protein